MLAVGSKPDGPFTRVVKGTYTLAGAVVEPQKPSQAQKPKSQPPRPRQAATPAKPAK